MKPDTKEKPNLLNKLLCRMNKHQHFEEIRTYYNFTVVISYYCTDCGKKVYEEVSCINVKD